MFPNYSRTKTNLEFFAEKFQETRTKEDRKKCVIQVHKAAWSGVASFPWEFVNGWHKTNPILDTVCYDSQVSLDIEAIRETTLDHFIAETKTKIETEIRLNSFWSVSEVMIPVTLDYMGEQIILSEEQINMVIDHFINNNPCKGIKLTKSGSNIVAHV